MQVPFFDPAVYDNHAELNGFPLTSEPIWILGVKYNLQYDRARLEEDVKSRILFTYRRDFSKIGSSGWTTDAGWGCMHRCGQMMLAQALLNRHLTRDWRWKRGKYDPKYFEILRLFQDKKDCCYSIHKIASLGTFEGKAIGEWFGPNTVMQVLRKLVGYDRWSGLAIHVAMDNTIFVEKIREQCLVDDADRGTFVKGSNVQSVILSAYLSSQCQQQPQKRQTQAASKQPCSEPAGQTSCVASELERTSCLPHSDSSVRQTNTADSAPETASGSSRTAARVWRPLLLVIPLRIGLSKVNPVYFNAVKTCFTFRQSVGIIGGKPSHAHWFIGCTENKLLYLDPHTTHHFVDIGKGASDKSYHSKSTSSMDISQLDPSIAVGFYCDSEGEFNSLCQSLCQTFVCRGSSTPLFEIAFDSPPSSSAVDCRSASDREFPTSGVSFVDKSLEDEYEIL